MRSRPSLARTASSLALAFLFNDVMAGPVAAFWQTAKTTGEVLDAGTGAPLEKTWRDPARTGGDGRKVRG